MLNIINTTDIDFYLKNFCGADTRLQTFLIAALKNVIQQRESSMELLSSLPLDAPEWLRQKWHDGGPWHRFDAKKDIRLAGRVFDAVSWLEAAIENDMAWTNQLDNKGRPRKLLQISTFEHLETISSKDRRQIADKKRKAAERVFLKEDLTRDFEKIMDFDNGFYIVRLKTKKALALEGAYLEHCMADGDYDYCLGGNVTQFYSLRDSNNLPCVSMCVEKDQRRMTQVRGRRNSYPKEKFIAYVATFCSQIYVDLSDALSFHEGFKLLRDDVWS